VQEAGGLLSSDDVLVYVLECESTAGLFVSQAYRTKLASGNPNRRVEFY